MKYTFLFLLVTHLSNAWCIEEIPLKPMHSAAQVVKEFNSTIIIYSAKTQYLIGSEYIAYNSIPGLYVGYVSPRIDYTDQFLINATHSIKKLIDSWSRPDFKYLQESLLTNPSVYEGELKIRSATKQEIKDICEQWCPDNYDFDYETWAMIKDIAINYCAGCP